MLVTCLASLINSQGSLLDCDEASRKVNPRPPATQFAALTRAAKHIGRQQITDPGRTRIQQDRDDEVIARVIITCHGHDGWTVRKSTLWRYLCHGRAATVDVIVAGWRQCRNWTAEKTAGYQLKGSEQSTTKARKHWKAPKHDCCVCNDQSPPVTTLLRNGAQSVPLETYLTLCALCV
jgi:hypothetical protein